MDSKADETSLEKLLSLGLCSKEEAEKLLQISGNNIELALNLLMDEGNTAPSDLKSPSTQTQPQIQQNLFNFNLFPSIPNISSKMILVVRMDLQMGIGKIAAQCSHASLYLYRRMKNEFANSQLIQSWEANGEPTIVVQCPNEEALLNLEQKAQSLNLSTFIVRDAGRTQVTSGTRTVLGIFGEKTLVDQVTGQLKLL